MEAFTKLNAIQHKNHETLMQYLNDYQPQAFGKNNWSHDPDYRTLQKEFFSVDKSHGSGVRTNSAQPMDSFKTKKKCKKIR
jgi:hypothetical protein